MVPPGFAKSIETHVGKYLKIFPGEADRLHGLLGLIRDTADENDLYSRNNFIGHITASGLVLSHDQRELLFIKHKYLDRHLQPGGHIDASDENIFAAARREVTEETGITDVSYIPYHIDYFLPIDIDTHDVPENRATKEPKHVHHDFRFLFRATTEVDLAAFRQRDSGELFWTSLDKAATQQTFQAVVEKIRVALSEEFLPRQFFRQVMDAANPPRRFSTIVVTHLLPDARSYLEAVSSISFIQAVIPKPKSEVREIRRILEKQFPIVGLSREEIRLGEPLYRLIDGFNGEFLLLDIGGYFAAVANSLASRYKNRILGIVEDTENGYQKYKAADKKSALELPVVSVARSPLKDTEDFLVGESVLFSADTVLRECGKLIQYKACAVLGFGKIGRSICHHLLLRGIKPAVHDIDPIRRVQAHNRLCETPERGIMLKNAGVIFSATGSQALNLLDFRNLKPGCFVFSVTSSDDEFDTRFLEADYEPLEIATRVFRYSRPDHHFYLVNQGNAVNFLHKAVLGSFIHLVRGEMLYASSCLARHELPNGISELDEKMRKTIAQSWLEIFNDQKNLATRFEIRDRDV
jgi:8-oxo-dGTP pyrophosphatase MutT (NUDIX family)